jgi:hypothetical protein
MSLINKKECVGEGTKAGIEMEAEVKTKRELGSDMRLFTRYNDESSAVRRITISSPFQTFHFFCSVCLLTSAISFIVRSSAFV